MIYPVIFAIAVGVGIVGHWSFSYYKKQIPELENEPIRIGFHIAAEMVTALCLLISGIAIMAERDWARSTYFVSVGMLFYTAIVSPGYFAQKGDWKWLWIFAVLIGGGVGSLLATV